MWTSLNEADYQEMLDAFPVRLQYYRKMAGISAVELSKELHFKNRSSVGTIERGGALPAFRKFLMIAARLGVTPNQLLGIDDWKYDDEIKRRINEVDAEGGIGADTEDKRVGVGGSI